MSLYAFGFACSFYFPFLEVWVYIEEDYWDLVNACNLIRDRDKVVRSSFLVIKWVCKN